MSDFMSLIIEGRLTKDPEIVNTNSGTVLVKFSIANNRYSNGKDKVMFLDCVAFGKTATYISEKIKKGEKVLISGLLEINEYTNKQGVSSKYTSIIVNTIKSFQIKSLNAESSKESSTPENVSYTDPNDPWA